MNRAVLKQIAMRSKAVLLDEIRPLTEQPQEAAYFAALWFMRLTALRFMDASGWLPDAKPLFPDGCTCARVDALCRRLARTPALYGLFGEDAGAYLPDTVLAADGAFLAQLMQIPDAQLRGFPEILGWLYQYQNTEVREEAFRKLRDHAKIPPEQIPAATQMFTPDWIVRFMTQNALGALCKPPESWQYCIPEAPQPPQVQRILQENAAPHRSPAELTVIDPCMGTGHILAYVFDALMELYLREGFAPENAAARILEHNLCGLDLDRNACVLAAFVLMMKARHFDVDILSKDIHPKLLHFSGLERIEIPAEYREFAAQFADAQTFGSLLRPKAASAVPAQLARMQELAQMLTRQYDAVITNPPYMSSSSMNPALSAFVRRHYPDSKSDLFAAFMERCTEMTAPHGCCAMITQHSWMFLSSYEKLRRRMQGCTLRSMVHLGARAFAPTDVGIIVQTAAFVCMGSHVPDYRTTYLDLTDAEDKERAFFDGGKRYICDIGRFSGIAGEPLCYWVSDRMRELLQRPRLGAACRICQGMTTSDNRRFLRLWHEVPPEEIAFGCTDAQAAAASGKRWFPYNKGGKVRRWYGNHTHVVDFYQNGAEMRAFHAELNKAHSGGRIKNEKMYFRPAVTWTFITESDRFGVRFQPEGFLFDVSGSCLFPESSEMLWQMGFLASRPALEILRIYNPTMNFQVENIAALPYLPPDESCRAEVEQLVSENIAIAREDWDSSEQSWDFRCHPLVRPDVSGLAEAFARWEADCDARRLRMQRNECRLNEIFLRLCGLAQELDPAVQPEETTLRRAAVLPDIQSFLRFAVGCMFGRYTIAGYVPLAENFLPEQQFVPELERFLTAVYGARTLEENLAYIARSLGETGDAREGIAHYFAVGFYPDHCLSWRHRPLYWMADSGRRHACRGLMYLHRMDGAQLGLLARYAAQRSAEITAEMDAICKNAGTEQKSASRRLALLRQQAEEIGTFTAHLEELADSGAAVLPDDGVQQNYERFRSILSALR